MKLSELEITQSNLWNFISYSLPSNSLMFDEITMKDSFGNIEIASYEELNKQRIGMGLDLISKLVGLEVKSIHNSQICSFCTNVEEYSIVKDTIEIKMLEPVIIAKVFPERQSIEQNGVIQKFISFKDFNFGIKNVVSMSISLKRL